MPSQVSRISDLQQHIWSGSIPLEIRLSASDCRTYDECDPYFIQYPRISYLAFIIPRLHAFFQPSLIEPDVQPQEAWLSFQGVPMKWHYPLGLLYDIFSGAEPADSDRQGLGSVAASQVTVEAASGTTPLPWRLTVHFTEYPSEQLIKLDQEGKQLHDLYINSVKEADFIRNGSARTVMSLGKEDSSNLWRAVQTHDLPLFNTVNTKLLNPPGMELRHIPIKIYLPTSASQPESTAEAIPEEAAKAGHIRVVQSLVPLHLPSRQTQTIGSALNGILPTIFPSRRNPILAQAILHGAVVPMSAPVDELGRAAAYADGFLHIAVVMLS